MFYKFVIFLSICNFYVIFLNLQIVVFVKDIITQILWNIHKENILFSYGTLICGQLLFSKTQLF